ncbi:MAG: alpha/beta fold hydrolase [Pseudomonadota bacterium]
MRYLRICTTCLLTCLAACSDVPDDEYYQPSGARLFDYASSSNFQAYREFETDKLRRHRVYFDPAARDDELARVAPFELKRPDTCEEPPTKGVLLVHGLLDTAFALRDIGEALASDCVLVRAIVLPGHGTRPADLIGIDRAAWIDAVAFGQRSLSEIVDEVYIIGYSLGGTLAANAAADNPDIAGVVLLAPALQVAYPWLAWQSVWLRYVRDWIDIDPHSIPVRYQSMPTNAIAETVLLASETRDQLEAGLRVPTLSFLSSTDLAINVEDVLLELSRLNAKSGNSIVIYGDTDLPVPMGAQIHPVFDRSSKILNHAHVALPFAPDNAVFGKGGSHKECGQNIGLIDKEDAEQCMRNPENWKGELGSTDTPEFLPLQRLTYNPHFDGMIDDIRAFLSID